MDLETIKKYDDSVWLYILKQRTVFDTDLIKTQKDWLIQQAEKVELLESEIEEYKKVVYILEKHNEQSQDMFNRVHDELEKAQELIKLLYNDLGGSADGDHGLWMKTKEYCFKNKIITYEK